jgi:hypothetical protein
MNIPQELTPYLKPDDLKYYQPADVVHRCESRQLLARIDELDRQIGAETTSKSDRRKLKPHRPAFRKASRRS